MGTSADADLHRGGRGNTDKAQNQLEHGADGVAGGQTCAGQLGVDRTALARQHLAGLVEAVEAGGQLLGEMGQAERRTVAGAGGDEVLELGDLAGERELGG